MDQRFPARYRNHRSAAFVHGRETFFDRKASVENGIWIIDLATTHAGEIAAEQWFQHQHQRIALAAEQLLLEQVGPDLGLFEKRHVHPGSFPSGVSWATRSAPTTITALFRSV